MLVETIAAFTLLLGIAGAQTEGSVRLFGRSNPHEGRVEIYHNGAWGTICDDSWDMNDARVVCRQLGYIGAASAPQSAAFGQGTGQIWLDQVSCSGSESEVSLCSHGGWGNHDCSHSEDASVICDDVAVRLVGGNTSYEGRVEIFHLGTWGTVCDDYWDINDATVICRMLGSPGAISAHSNAFFGQGSGQIWLDDVSCTGSESVIDQCATRGWGSHNCRHIEDASVRCQPPVRLVNGQSRSEGRVEVYHQSQWGTVCDDSWDLNEARVVCRILGYPGAISAHGSATHGQGSGPILLDDMTCTGDETSLVDCSHSPWGSHNCGHNEDASVVCEPGPSIRLVGGSSPREGRVEVLYNGEWGTVCDDGFDNTDAQVVCSSLGFDGVALSLSSAAYGQGSGQIWLDDVSCVGSENSLAECSHGGWGTHNCAHSEDVSVMCVAQETTTPYVSRIEVRLADGPSRMAGRVEILQRGTWGTICDDSFDINDANVICKMMGSEGALSAYAQAYYGEGSGQIWLDDLSCTGNEDSIEQCRHGGWGSHNCRHSEDASVVCQPKVRLVGGNSSGEGRVEIFYNEQWGTICDDNWDINDAQVVCRMIGSPEAISVPPSSTYGGGSDPIWLDEVSCTGSEMSLEECTHAGWGSHNCVHAEDAVVVCRILRLVGGSSPNEGRVEVLHNNEWGTVCDDNWGTPDAEVVCWALGYPGADAALQMAVFGQGKGKIWLDDLGCTGNEDSIADCSNRGWGVHNCAHLEDASVRCNLPVRLVGGASSSEGRVEIFHDGQWGTVCDDMWDINDAQVVCRMLGYSRALSALSMAHFGQGTGLIYLDDLRCTGSESSIKDCPHLGMGVHNCGHNEDASVQCA